MKVREVMHEGASWIDPDASLVEVANRMRDDVVGALPIGANDRLIGMVTDRDVVVLGLSGMADPLQLTAKDVMSAPIVWCSAEEDVEDAVRIMERKRIRRLPVIDQHRRMVGMLGLADIAARAGPTVCTETLRAVATRHA
jgi:CBS domain-containing protein